MRSGNDYASGYEDARRDDVQRVADRLRHYRVMITQDDTISQAASDGAFDLLDQLEFDLAMGDL